MPARHDHHRVQTGDGYAAYVAGQIVGAPIGVTTDEQASWWGGKGVGTVPHALIAAYGGNTVLAATKFADWAPEDLNVTVLVASRRRSRRRSTSRVHSGLAGRAPRHVGEPCRQVALNELGDFRPTGVNARLVRSARRADADGRAREDRRFGWVHGREDRGVRAGGRRSMRTASPVADPGAERFPADVVGRRPPSAKVGRVPGQSAPELARLTLPRATQ